jgi:ABC-type branched-subunit amino acid transport system permease subunit
MTYAVATLGLNLITGYVGQVSLGHNAFFALGSYTAVLANHYLGTGSFISVLLAGFVTFIAGVLAGYPAKRLRGLYLALITLILAVSVVPMIKQFKAYTGAAAGFSSISRCRQRGSRWGRTYGSITSFWRSPSWLSGSFVILSAAVWDVPWRECVKAISRRRRWALM